MVIMRKKLKELGSGERYTFIGTFERWGEKPAYRGYPIKTILLKDVKLMGGDLVTDHLWFTAGKQFESFSLSVGDCVQFNARVKPYTKGYKGYREDVYNPISIDYKLERPTKVLKII